jgi:hypothetical protein
VFARRVCVTRKIKIRHSKLRGPKGLSRRQKDRGPNYVLSDSADPETAPGSSYGFPICILCESRKRHQGPIMDFLCAYCARAGKGTLHQHPVSYLSMSKLMFKTSDHLHTTMDYTPLPRPASIRRAANIRRREWRDKCRQALSDHLSMLDSDLWTVPQLTKL